MDKSLAKYYSGIFHSQFVSAISKDSKGLNIFNIQLEQRFILNIKQEVTLEEYEAAKSNRISIDTLKWQSTFHSGYNHDVKELHPHVLLTDNNDIELVFQDGSSSLEICSELYVEYGNEIVSDALKEKDFTAFKDNHYHGRLTGLGFVRIPILNEEEKEKKRIEILARYGKKQRGCLAPFFSVGASTGRWGRLFGMPGSNRMAGGCGRTGCGLISLLMLLGLLLSIWKGCQNMTGNSGGRRVIHDTVYVDEKSKQDIIKQFLDTTKVFKTDAIELPNVQFFSNSANLLPYSISSIQQLADYLIAHPHVNAIIEGHTDNVGDPLTNLKLSQARAETVRQVLISFGVVADRVEAKGIGKNRPRAANETIEGRALNRRVEVRLINTDHTETTSTELVNEN